MATKMPESEAPRSVAIWTTVGASAGFAAAGASARVGAAVAAAAAGEAAAFGWGALAGALGGAAGLQPAPRRIAPTTSATMRDAPGRLISCLRRQRRREA